MCCVVWGGGGFDGVPCGGPGAAHARERALTSSEAATIRVGQTTSAELIQSFGAPTSRADRPDGTATWQWCATTTESSSGHVLLLWDRDSTKTATQCTTVELAGGVVTAVNCR